MKPRHRAIISGLTAFGSLALTAVLWQHAVILTIGLVVCSAISYRIRPTKTNRYIYLTTFICGPLAEALAIWGGAWSYARPVIIGVPLWLPFVWGNAGLFIANLADRFRMIDSKS